MANVDVADLLVDPDFVDAMSMINRTPTLNSLGENVLVDAAPVVSVGSIQPVSGQTMKKLPDGLQNENIRSFWFKGTIPTTGAGIYTAILTFRSARYQVRHVFDWTNFGQGWSEGVCVAEVPAP